MRKVLLLMSALAGVAALSGQVAAQDAIGKAFADTLFEEETISATVREHPEVSALTKDEMNRILQVRDALSLFFQRLKGGAGGSVTELLTPSLASTYKDRNTVRRERFGAESYLSYEIIDFRISQDGGEVKFRYFLRENDRGRTMVRQRAMTFRNTGGRWLIAEFDNFEFE